MRDVVLWHFPISHYNEKARWALDWKRVPHRRVALGASYLPRALWATGQGSLPILFIDGAPVADSTAILARLEREQPVPALYPADPDARARALALEDFFDEELGHALRAAALGPLFETDPAGAIGVLSTGMSAGAARFMRAALPVFRAFYVRRHHIHRDTLDRERAKVRAAMDRLAAELQPSGYLVGEGFTVADLTAAALLSPVVLPPELEYASAVPPLLADYRASLASHPAFGWVGTMYARHRGTSAEVRASAA